MRGNGAGKDVTRLVGPHPGMDVSGALGTECHHRLCHVHAAQHALRHHSPVADVARDVQLVVPAP